jgi:hypothetical protein
MLVRPSATPATWFLAPEDRRADVFRERERPDEEDGFDAAIVLPPPEVVSQRA